MSSTPAIPATTKPASTGATVWSDIILTHHPIIRLAIIAALIWLAIGKADTMWSNHEQRVFDAKSAQLSVQVALNASQASQNAKQAADNAALAEKYKELTTQVMAENTKLEQGITSAQAAQAQQQIIDHSLQPPQLAQRWAALAQIPVPDITPEAGGSFGITGPGALSTVLQLETIPTLKTELQNTRGEKANDEKQLAAQGASVAGLNQQVGGLETENAGLKIANTEEVQTCAAQVGAVKAKARKDKRNAFLKGLGTGAAVVAGLVLKFAL